MDRIVVEGLIVPMRVGVTDEERREPQDVRLDLELHLPLAAAGRSDDLAQTVDYSAVTGEIARLVSGLEARLLEHVAERVAEALLRSPGLERVTVRIAKVLPPVPERVEAISVRIERP